MQNFYVFFYAGLNAEFLPFPLLPSADARVAKTQKSAPRLIGNFSEFWQPLRQQREVEEAGEGAASSKKSASAAILRP
jgi:hypothetical protein